MVAAASLEPAAAGVARNTDMDALTALRNGLQDPDGALKSWDTTLVNPCTWFYITCDGDNRVIRLDLQKKNLSGTLAPELGQMDRLQYLYALCPSLSPHAIFCL
ncbi:hypothetical protein HU200_024132 [Digitaria exilis]|uniref:Leucine-rich repeat-containing N-terminal plant-type domain-containing protein n=1 Tax=Digitaria exilis TaxID=1010633 RepID=A0A835EY30_9POAL|nr:hypothetical protein HU200_024132 [Digitaria exilis]